MTKSAEGFTKCLFATMFACYLVVHLDHGIMPAAIDQIEKDLQIGEAQTGLLGSLVYAGNAMGSFIAPIVFQRFHPKWIIVTSVLLNSLCLLVFPFTKNFTVISISRVCVGIFQVISFSI
jgi:sugar phosphate permease